MLNHSHPDSLPLIQTSDFLPPLGRWTLLGGLVIVTAVGLSIPVAAVTKYKETVKAQAVVRPAGELRLVQAASDGKVMQIMVAENQVVKTGDAIAIIDDSKLQTKKANYKAISSKPSYS
jgi:multidrug efflux pump subunit AcrA (membrane-fusion protein)